MTFTRITGPFYGGSSRRAIRFARAREINARAADYERRAIGPQLRAGKDPLCAHYFPYDNPSQDPNVVQAEGQAACIAAQLAALTDAEKAEWAERGRRVSARLSPPARLARARIDKARGSISAAQLGRLAEEKDK